MNFIFVYYNENNNENTSENISKNINEIINENINEIINENKYWNGVKHLFSPTTVNKYELCNIVNTTYDLNITINRHETNIVDKSITSIYEKIFEIPELDIQINEMKNYVF